MHHLHRVAVHLLLPATRQVFKHHHEESTGRTSSIGQHNLCLDSGGGILNDSQFRSTNCGDYVRHASKVVTLVDLAGAEHSSAATTRPVTQQQCTAAHLVSALPILVLCHDTQ
jgi:GTPase